MGSVSGLRDARVDVAEEKYAARRADSDCVYTGVVVSTVEEEKTV